MDKDNNLNIGSETDGFSVDSILAEYEAERSLFGEPEKKAEDEVGHIIYDSSEQAISEVGLDSDETGSSSSPLRADEPEEAEYEEAAFVGDGVLDVTPSVTEEFDFGEAPLSTEEEFDFGELTSSGGEPLSDNAPNESTAAPDAPSSDEYSDELIAGMEIEDESGEYAAARDYKSDPRYEARPPRAPDFRERFLGPILGLILASAQKREDRLREEKERLALEQKEQQPELRADRAAAFYHEQAQSIRIRGFFATLILLPLLYLSFGLPALGLLGSSPTIKALVCLVLELAIIVIGLDVFTNGVLTLIKGKAGAESLIAIACIVSAIDAAIIATAGNTAVGLPFCGAAALAVTLALWGNYFSCRGFAFSMGTASRAETPSVVLSLSGVDEEGCVLVKSKRPVTGFVRTSESADAFESAYRLAAPVLIAGSVVLTLFCFFASEKCDNLIHTLAAATTACASLSAVFGFAFPFYVMSKRLAKSGVAIAGYSGAADLGRIRRVLVSDTDIFPLRTVSIADVSISETARPDTVISYTGSMIAAAGMGIAPVFTELMRKNGCSMQKVEEFACHEGGGLVARINGDQVYVGTSGFMQLMGVRLPRGTSKSSAIYTAINDSLTGIISISYKPVASVQRALVSLLRGKTEPLFAVRDFNITPMLVKQKFRLPMDSYNFPSFADRYRISSPVAEESGTVVAMFTRGGLNSVAGLSKRGRGLYNRLRICLALSIIGAVFGLAFMLMLCWTGSYDSASCGNLIIYMLLWLVPTLVTTLGLRG